MAPSTPRSASVAAMVTMEVPRGDDSDTEKVVPAGTLVPQAGSASFTAETWRGHSAAYCLNNVMTYQPNRDKIYIY